MTKINIHNYFLDDEFEKIQNELNSENLPRREKNNRGPCGKEVENQNIRGSTGNDINNGGLSLEDVENQNSKRSTGNGNNNGGPSSEEAESRNEDNTAPIVPRPGPSTSSHSVDFGQDGNYVGRRIENEKDWVNYNFETSKYSFIPLEVFKY